jgi:hypothetical protein
VISTGTADTAIGRLSWKQLRGDANTVPAGEIFETPTGFAAIETSEAGGNPRFWESPDGEEWAIVAMPVPVAGFGRHHLAAGEHWIMSNDFRLWRSRDIVTWTEVDLERAAHQPIEGVRWKPWIGAPTTIGATTVLPVGLLADLELDGRDRREVLEADTIRVDQDGSVVTVTDVGRDVVLAEIDAAALGTDPDMLALQLRNELVFRAPGGAITLTDDGAHAVLTGRDVTFIEAIGGRFVAMTGDVHTDDGPGSRTVWGSIDGLDWESLGPPSYPSSGTPHLALLSRHGDVRRPLAATVVIDEAGTQRVELWSSEDGQTWALLGQVSDMTPMLVPSGGYIALDAPDERIHVSATGSDWETVDGPQGVGADPNDSGGTGWRGIAHGSIFDVQVPNIGDRTLWVLTQSASALT